MMDLLKKISLAKNNRTTYKAGLLQAHAFRILKQETAKVLRTYGIATTEWAFLGLLYEEDSMRFSDAAQLLGVEPPFVTEMVARLRKKDLIQETKDTVDTRAKALSLTTKGKKFVAEVEPVVRAGMRPLISGVSPRDLLGYLTVLAHIIEKKTK